MGDLRPRRGGVAHNGDTMTALPDTNRAAKPRLRGRPAPRNVLAVASFGAFLAFLDATAVNLAVPSLESSFPTASLTGVSWVLNAYNVVFAAFLVPFGGVADRIGRRRLFAVGTIVFTVASIACAIAPSLGLLITARIIQAFGAAMLVPASLAVVVAAFPAAQRARAVGAWSASAAVAAAIGPPLGGMLVELGGWRWVFLANVPFGIAAIVLSGRALVESRSFAVRGLPDVGGAVLLSGALALAVLGVVEIPREGWTSPWVIGSLVGAALLAAGFVGRSRAHPRPVLDAMVLRNSSFAWGALATVLAGMGFFAYLLTNILWLQHIWGYRVVQAGLALVPGALVAAVSAAAAGRLVLALGRRTVVTMAALVWCSAYVWYAVVLGPEPEFVRHWLPGQVLSGLGSGATLSLLGSTVLETVPNRRFATSSGIASASRQAGGALGIAAVVLVVGDSLPALGRVLDPADPATAEAVGSVRQGWLISAACFAVIALIGLLRLREPASVPVEDGERIGADSVRIALPAAAESEADDPQALRPYAKGSYLDDLPEGLRQRLDGVGTQVHLPAGEWLFREGDRAVAMYVVSAGRLEVVQDEHVIRELGPGSVLGELALLSGDETRSASVRARRDTVLSEVSHSDFDLALSQERGAHLALAGALARALQSGGRRGEGASSQANLVAVIGLSPASQVAEVAAALGDLLGALPTHPRVHTTGDVGMEALAQAEQANDRVILVAPWPKDERASQWWEACRRQADRVVLVAERSDEAPTSWVVSGTAPDLVVVARSGSPTLPRQVVEDWCGAVEPDRVIGTTTRDLRTALRPVAAAIGGCSLGLVLGGGGARALAHIGVIHELEASGLVIDRVAGTSLGAIMAAAYAAGRTADELEAVTYEEFVRRNPVGDYTVPTHALVKGARTDAALRRSLGEFTRIEALPRQFRCVSTNLLERKLHVHRSGVAWHAVSASARLPLFFPPVRDGSRLLVDGGILDNLPVTVLTERDEGPVIAVNIGNAGAGRPRDPNRPPRMPGIGETLFRTMTIGSAGAVEKARAAGAYVISPPSLGVGLVEFHQIDRMIEAGRIAARALLDATGADLLKGA